MWGVVGPQVATAAVTAEVAATVTAVITHDVPEVGVRVAVQVAVPAAGGRDVDRLLAFFLDGQGDVEHGVVVREL